MNKHTNEAIINNTNTKRLIEKSNDIAIQIDAFASFQKNSEIINNKLRQLFDHSSGNPYLQTSIFKELNLALQNDSLVVTSISGLHPIEKKDNNIIKIQISTDTLNVDFHYIPGLLCTKIFINNESILDGTDILSEHDNTHGANILAQEIVSLGIGNIANKVSSSINPKIIKLLAEELENEKAHS